MFGIVRAIVLFNILGLALIAFLEALSKLFKPEHSLWLGPYFHFISERSLIPYQLFLLLLILGLFTICYEYFARRLIQQRWIADGSKSKRLTGILIVSFVLAIAHSYFSIFGAVFGGFIGLAMALYYDQTQARARVVLMLFHLQWNCFFVIATLLMAIGIKGEARNHYLFFYKLRTIEKGELFYRTDWGWLDRHHNGTACLLKVKKEILTTTEWPVKISLTDGFIALTSRPMLGIESTFIVYEPEEKDEMTLWAISAGVCFQHTIELELAQQSMPWYDLSHFSAWQFDDLPSVILSILDHSPGAEELTEVNKLEIHDKEELKQLWLKQGLALVSKAYDSLFPPQLDYNKPTASRRRELMNQVITASNYWQSTSDVELQTRKNRNGKIATRSKKEPFPKRGFRYQ